MRVLVINVLRQLVIDERALLSVCLVFHVFYLYVVVLITHHFPSRLLFCSWGLSTIKKKLHSLFQSKMRSVSSGRSMIHTMASSAKI